MGYGFEAGWYKAREKYAFIFETPPSSGKRPGSQGRSVLETFTFGFACFTFFCDGYEESKKEVEHLLLQATAPR